MSKYTIEHRADFVDIPLDVLAQRHGPLSEAQTKERVDTALHEATHILAAVLLRGSVLKAKVNTTGRPDRRGSFGHVDACGHTAFDDAFISYVGHAWEARHGAAPSARADLKDGDRHAAQCGIPREVLLHNAAEFVRVGDDVIRIVAAYLLALLPKSGVLQGRSLRRLVEHFRSSAGGRVPEGEMAKKWDLGAAL